MKMHHEDKMKDFTCIHKDYRLYIPNKNNESLYYGAFPNGFCDERKATKGHYLVIAYLNIHKTDREEYLKKFNYYQVLKKAEEWDKKVTDKNTLEIFKPLTDHYNVPNSLYYEFVYKTIGYFPLTPQNFPYCKSFKTLQILVNSIKSHHKIIMSPVTSTDPSHRYTPQDISLKCRNNDTCITSPHQTDNQNIIHYIYHPNNIA
jgi:hypothetical protein